MKLPFGFLALFALYLVTSTTVAADSNRNLAVSAAKSSTEKRIALVIGNSSYPSAALTNPVNDARDMATALRKLGFDVIEKLNVSQKEMNLAIVQFGEKLQSDSTALFFFAGHGVQVRGKNYLIPVDAQITTEAMVRAETVDVDTVMDQLSISPLNIVILDACRNNPFERRFRSMGGGLAQMDAPKGSIIAYATAPGKVASDGNGKNGLYTQELLKHIQTPGLALEAVFKRVRNGVMSVSGEAQTPWESSSLTGDFYFVPAAAVSAQANADKEAEALKQALKDQQAANDRAVEEALKQARKDQRESTDRAVEEALRKANEQAARDRLELQKSMEKMLQDALARQATQLAQLQATQTTQQQAIQTAINAQGASGRQPANDETKLALASPAPSATAPSSPALPTPLQTLQGEARPGDEWEYVARDNMFGKQGKLLMRVKAVTAGGILEEIFWNGTHRLDWAFDGKFSVIGGPNESEFLIAPHWKPDKLAEVSLAGGIGAWANAGALLQLNHLKVIGQESLQLGPGTFEAIKIQGYFVARLQLAGAGRDSDGSGGVIEFWYSPKLGRVLKQRATFRGGRQRFDETIELIAIRQANS